MDSVAQLSHTRTPQLSFMGDVLIVVGIVLAWIVLVVVGAGIYDRYH